MGFYGICGVLWWFYGILMGFNDILWDFMGFYGGLMGFYGGLMGSNMTYLLVMTNSLLWKMDHRNRCLTYEQW